ncbi:hypothetical protein ACJX0J_001720 [Zea mays]
MIGRKASHVDRTFYSLSIDSLPIGWIYLVPEPLDALSPFNPLSEIRVALWRAHSIYDFAFMDVNIPVLPLNESNLPKDVIYSLSLSIYGKNCTHAMIFKSFLLKWNSDFRTISYKRMSEDAGMVVNREKDSSDFLVPENYSIHLLDAEIHHFA